MGWRFDKGRLPLPRIEWRRTKAHPAGDTREEPRGRTYVLREAPQPSPVAPLPPPPRRGSFIDWRGIGILVTTREFVDRSFGVAGEALITAGVFVLLFLGWHVGFNDIISGMIQDRNSAALSRQWDTAPKDAPEFNRASANSGGAIRETRTPVVPSPAKATVFATVIVPRFGENYVRTIAESVDLKTVLNNLEIGVGHYPTSADLGAVGNFALAGHRTTYGAPFGDVDQLRVGDRIYVETSSGWYVYRFRNMEYVYPTETSVLNAVPQTLIAAKDRILTMTSCHPKLSAAERIISYSVFESFVPRRFGAPAEISRTVGAG